MNKKNLNIINVNIKDEYTVTVECIYKHEKHKKISVLLKDSNKHIKIEYNTVDFSKELDVTKINIIISPIKKCLLEIKIKEDGNIFDTIILDNKNERISSRDNEYIIFLKKNKIKILQNKITIEDKKILDKLKNEIKKQLYSVKTYKRLCILRLFARNKKQYYLFNDRIMYGDDNAEQLFKYINKEHKKMAKNSYFILDRKSPKIKEIRRYGKILKYGTLRHKIIYLNSKMIISSHASYFDRVYNPLNEEEMDVLKDLITKKFVFLQHGVIFNDVHKMLNRPQIIADLFVTTTNKEYEEILSEKYMYNKDIVKCTGLARFDKLENSDNRIILIAPTWRTYLTDAQYGDENKQLFEKSDFYKKYKKILENEKLLNKLKQSKYKIYFLLHPAFIQFRKKFEKYNNASVKVLSTETISYSELFKECSIFVTDYSSTHFDVAFLNKPVIYYQFDIEKFYDSHYEKGYFNYEKDGFGDVLYDEKTLIEELVKYIDNGCKIKEEYKEKIKQTFKYLDRNNSERIYKEIVKLDSNNEINYRFNNVH